MLRVRAASFFMGFAVASALAMYQVQKDVWASHQTLSAQAQGYHSDLESRIVRLEKSNGFESKPKEVFCLMMVHKVPNRQVSALCTAHVSDRIIIVLVKFAGHSYQREVDPYTIQADAQK